MDYDQAKDVLGSLGDELERLVEKAFVRAGDQGQRGREALETQLVGLLASVIGAPDGHTSKLHRARECCQMLEAVVKEIENCDREPS